MTLPLLVFFSSVWLVPESPLWLVKKDYWDQAKQSLQTLRGSQYQGLQQEIDEMQQSLEETGQHLPLKDKIQFLLTKPVIKPMVIVAVLLFCQVIT